MGKFKKEVFRRDADAEYVRDIMTDDYDDTSTYQYGIMIGMELMQSIYQGRDPEFVPTPVHLQCDCDEEVYVQQEDYENIEVDLAKPDGESTVIYFIHRR